MPKISESSIYACCHSTSFMPATRRSRNSPKKERRREEYEASGKARETWRRLEAARGASSMKFNVVNDTDILL